jgi:hypothetical protein
VARWGLVLDASTSRVTRADFRRLKEMGVQGFIQCLQTGGFSASQAQVAAVAPYNLGDALAEGVPIGGYLNSQPWRPAEVIHLDAKRVANTFWPLMPMVANDVEIGGITAANVQDAAHLLTIEGKRDPIYTAKWFWDSLGNPQWPWLLEKRLWNAFYDGDPDIDFRNYPYGPWSQAHVSGEQYQGSTNLGGDVFDLNFFDLDYLTTEQPAPVPAPEEGKDMFLIETVDLPQNKWYAVSAGGKRYLDDGVELELYQRDSNVHRTKALGWQADQIPDVLTPANVPTTGLSAITAADVQRIAQAVADILDVKVD